MPDAAWALSYFFFSFDLAWGDDPAGFFIEEYLQVGEPGFGFEFVPGVLIPLVYMLVSRIVTLVTDGYDTYPMWYLAVLGWGTIAAAIVAAWS